MRISSLLCVASLSLALIAPALAEETKAVAKNVNAKQGSALVQTHKDSKDLIVLDVRTPAEFAKNRIAGAKNVDVLAANFEAKAKKLDKSKTYLVHCRSGKRSQTAFKTLKKLGFTKLYHLDGGMMAWQAADLPVETGEIKVSETKS